MPNVKNQETLAVIKEELSNAGAVWVVDYCGLTVKEVQELRRSVREAGASMKVYKNTLVHIALEDAELPTLDDMLNGPSAFVFAGEDVAAAAKAVKNFAKGNRQAGDQGWLDGRQGRYRRRGRGYRFSALSRGTARPHRCRYRRCCQGSRRLRQWRAPGSGPGHQGRRRPEGCLIATAA